MLVIAIALLIFSASVWCGAVVPIDHAVQLSATTQTSPPKVTINWAVGGGPTGYTVYRRAFGSTTWTQVATYGSSATSHVDTNVSVGAKYEYQVVRTGVTTAYGYILSGIEVPSVDNRGKVILLIDQTMTLPLANEIDRLIWDLRGDGWCVIRHNVQRTATPDAVKNIIKADYQADTSNVKAVFILGHVPMFMSGAMAPDGHSARPWPADEYYGDMNGTWVGNSTVWQPSTPELQVGRVDLWNLPTFSPLTETDLLRRYLNKDHNYRTHSFAVQMKGIVDDGFGEFGGEAFAQNGWRNFAPFVGAGYISSDSWLTPVTTPYLWICGCGSGTSTSYGGAGGGVSTRKLVTIDPGVFTFAFGSFFGQWDVQDCFLRAVLATPQCGLACAWAGRPNWFVHHMALGETIGYSSMLTQSSQTNGYSPAGSWATGVHVALMGDPTVRAFMIAPASDLSASLSGTGGVELTWTASTDSILGYYVYSSDNENGPYTRLTATPVSAVSYIDAAPTLGDRWYMVKPVVLSTTPSGSFYNTGQGVFTSIHVPFTDIPTSGLKLWLKPEGVASGPVSSWVDSSGTGMNLRQDDLSKEPQGLKSSVRFDGNDALTSASRAIEGTSGFTTFLYAKPESTTTSSTLFWNGDGSATGGYGVSIPAPGTVSAGWGMPATSATAPIATGKWSEICTRYDGALSKLWVNNTLFSTVVKTDSNCLTGGFTLGDYGPQPGSGFTGDISELLIYGQALSDTDRGRVHRYLADRYGRPVAEFINTPEGGLAPLATTFDASSSVDPDGSIAACSWDFGDESTGTGAVNTHTYSSPGAYKVTLKVTDNEGQASSTSRTIFACTGITETTLSASPACPRPSGTLVTLTAGTMGGYRVLYQFWINDGSGWRVYRDFEEDNVVTWTPTRDGLTQFKVRSRSTGSSNDYDSESSIVCYIAGDLPTSGLQMWLRGDSGVTTVDGGLVTLWTDLSEAGNSPSQGYTAESPKLIPKALADAPVVRFSGAGCVLYGGGTVLSGSTDFTVFAAARSMNPVSTSAQDVLWIGNQTSTGGYGIWFDTLGRIGASWGSQSAAVTTTSPAKAMNWYTVTTTCSAGTHQLWVDGKLVSSATKTDSSISSGFSIGNFSIMSPNAVLNGDVGEVLVYNRALTSDEIAKVQQYLAGHWTSPVPVMVDKLSDARRLPSSTPVTITSPKTAIATSSDFIDGGFYLEEPDRACGMKIMGTSAALWDNIALSGVVDADINGEKSIVALDVTSRSRGSEIRPLGMSNGSVTGSGQLVKVWGRIVDFVDVYIIIDDGSPNYLYIDAGQAASGIYQPIDYNNYITVTGISGLGTGGRPVVRPRSDSDIVILIGGY